VCGGTGYGCDDGLACTTDTCDGSGGCTHTITAGNCLIDNLCRTGGDANPANGCQVCDPAHASSWSNQANDTPCTSPASCLNSHTGLLADGTCQSGSCQQNQKGCDTGYLCVGRINACVTAGYCVSNDDCDALYTCDVAGTHDCVLSH
jgi:hypothetical protein